jgi:2-haloacid dehalogenase
VRSFKLTTTFYQSFADNVVLADFSNLAAFPDVLPGLSLLKAKGYRLAAFSNGPEKAVRALMDKSGILPQLDDVISVDDVRTYKPSPLVYQHLMRRTGATVDSCWMVSGNPWDVIGAKAAGLKVAWIQREPAKIFDPWGVEPDLIVRDLLELSRQPLTAIRVKRRTEN